MTIVVVDANLQYMFPQTPLPLSMSFVLSFDGDFKDSP